MSLGATNPLELTELQKAARDGDHVKLKQLINNDVDPNARSKWGLTEPTPLCLAAVNGHIDMLKLLIPIGAGIYNPAPGVRGKTPLQAIAEAGHIEILKLLIEAGADVNTLEGSRFGRTALQAAAGRGHEEAVTELIVRNIILLLIQTWGI
jgi:ankyrin repeat protein